MFLFIVPCGIGASTDMGSVFPHHISYSMGADRDMGKRFVLVSF